MSGPSWTTDGGSGSGPSWTQQETTEVQVPEGFKLVEQYDDGSYVASNEDSGQLTFVDPSGYTTTNLSQITEIMNSKEGAKRAGDIVKGEISQEIAGELPTRATSAFEYFPFLRE